MVGRPIGLVEQMKHGSGLVFANADAPASENTEVIHAEAAKLRQP